MKRLSPTRIAASLAMTLAPLSGCAPSTLSFLVPKLELRLRMQRVGTERQARASDHLETGLSALLKWQPAPAARSVASRVELTPSSWIAPCALDDVACLQEVAEAEAEVAAALRGAR